MIFHLEIEKISFRNVKLLALNFSILAKEDFTGFYFRGFKLNDSSVLNVVFFFQN